MAVANDATLTERDGQWVLVGEPTEGALVTLARKLDLDLGEVTRSRSCPSSPSTS
jgi:magnesium-transporting ATPase (P-type)